MVQPERNLTCIHEDEGSIPGLLSGLGILCCHQAGSYSSDLTPSLGTYTCFGCGPKKAKQLKLKRQPWWSLLCLSRLRS